MLNPLFIVISTIFGYLHLHTKWFIPLIYSSALPGEGTPCAPASRIPHLSTRKRRPQLCQARAFESQRRLIRGAKMRACRCQSTVYGNYNSPCGMNKSFPQDGLFRLIRWMNSSREINKNIPRDKSLHHSFPYSVKGAPLHPLKPMNKTMWKSEGNTWQNSL